jgi:hypothetical protein
VGIILVAGIFISASVQDALETDITSTGTVTNETGADINITGYTLDSASVTGFASPIITAIFNATDDAVILVGNATVSDAGVVTNATVTTWENVTISYTYTYPSIETSAASNASGDLVVSLSSGSAWITILVVVGFAIIILSILTSGFIGNSKEQKYAY